MQAFRGHEDADRHRLPPHPPLLDDPALEPLV
jgi:hypothetical protein